jgi:hypothetical protein
MTAIDRERALQDLLARLAAEQDVATIATAGFDLRAGEPACTELERLASAEPRRPPSLRIPIVTAFAARTA